MPCVKVGINEWVVINRANHAAFSLWTDGLSGCVGVAIATRERAFLTHIDSHVSVEEWQKEVAAQFAEAIKTLGSLADAEFCEIVIGDDDNTPLSVAVLKTLNKFWDEAQTPDFDPEMTVKQSGVRIYFEGESKFRFQTLRNMGGYQAAWGKNQNSESGAAHIERQGFFRNGDRADV